MVHHDEEEHEEADEEGDVPGHFAHLGCVFGGDGEVHAFGLEGHLVRHVLQAVVEVDLLIHFLLVAQQRDQLIPLGLPLDPHHDGVAGVVRELLEDGVVGEVDELEALLVAVVAADLDREDELVELRKEIQDGLVVVLVLVFGEVDEILLEPGRQVRFPALLLVRPVLVVVGYLPAFLLVHLNLLQNVENGEDVLELVVEHGPFLLDLPFVLCYGLIAEFGKQLFLELLLVEVAPLDLQHLGPRLENFHQVLLYDDPQELGLALGNVFLDEDVVVSLEVAEGQIDAFLVDGFELAEGVFLVFLGADCEFAVLYVFVVEEVVCEVAEVFEEGALHEGDLVVDARELGDFVDEFQEGLRDADDLGVHDLEEFAQEKRGDLYEVDGVGLFECEIDIVVLFQQELLHLGVVVLAEQLQEAEHPAERLLVASLVPHFRLVEGLAAESALDHVGLAVEVVVGIHDGVGKSALLADSLVLDLAYFDQNQPNVVDKSLDGRKHGVVVVSDEHGQEAVLAVGVAIEQIGDSQQQRLVQDLQFVAEGRIVLEYRLDELGTSAFHDQILPCLELGFSGLDVGIPLCSVGVFLVDLPREVVCAPLIHRQLVVLPALNGLSNEAPRDLEHKDLLLILDGVVVVHDELEGFGEDLLERQDRPRPGLADCYPALLVVELAGLVDQRYGADQLVELLFLQLAEHWRLLDYALYDVQPPVQLRVLFVLAQGRLRYHLEDARVGGLDVRFVQRSRHLPVLLGDDLLERLALAGEDGFDVDLLELLRLALLLLPHLRAFLGLLPLFPGLDVPDHAGKVLEEAFGVVVDVVFLFGLHPQVVLVLGNRSLDVVAGLLFEVLDVQPEQHLDDVLFDFLDEGVDDLFGVELVEAADVLHQLDQLVVNLALVLHLVLLLLHLALQDLQKLSLQQHLLHGDEDLEDHLHDLADGKLEADAVGNHHLVVDALVPVQGDQVLQLVVYDLELFPDELLEQEDIAVFVHVVQPVYVRADGPPQLPPVRVLQALQAVRVRVDVLQLTHVYEVFALH